MYVQPPTDATKTVRVLRNPEGRETQLRISVRLENNHKEVVQCPALIDTGAEICVIQKGLVPEDLLRPAQRPLRLVGANERRLEGGDREVTLTLCTWGVNMGSKKKYELRISTIFYVADIKDPLILSYAWCSGKGVDISPRQHGLLCSRKGEEFWVEGIRSQNNPHVDTAVNTVGTGGQTRRALDLFSGTASVARVLIGRGYEVMSLDIDPRYNPTVCVDIFDWDYHQYPPGYFSLITASPPLHRVFSCKNGWGAG